MSLELVKPVTPEQFEPGELTSYLADSVMVHRFRTETGVHQFDFDAEFDGETLAGALALDATVVCEAETPVPSEARRQRGIRNGLKTLTYPNSRIMRKGSRQLMPEARQQLQVARGDIRGLLSAIEYPEHHRMVPATMTLYGEMMADVTVDFDLQNLKSAELRALCNEFGVALDEIALRRLKGRNRDTYVDADQYVSDAEALKARYRLRKFRRATILPDEEDTTLTDAGDWPSEGWAEKANAIQLQRQLPPLRVDDLGMRYRVLIRDDSSARHVVRPRLLIQDNGPLVASNGQTYGGQRLLFEPTVPEYDRTTHTVVHTSPVLGAVLLMNQLVAPSVLRRPLRAALFGKDRRAGPQSYTQNEAYTDKAFGLSPLLAQASGVQNVITGSPSFKRLLEVTKS